MIRIIRYLLEYINEAIRDDYSNKTRLKLRNSIIKFTAIITALIDKSTLWIT